MSNSSAEFRGPNFFRRVAIGIQRAPFRVLSQFIIAFTVLWTIVDAIHFFVPNLPVGGWQRLTMLVVASIVFAVVRCRAILHATIHMRNTPTSVSIEFGDLFAFPGQKVIAVNEFFDSNIGDHVAAKSVHGMFIKDKLGGQSSAFDNLVCHSLAGKPHVVVERKSGNKNKYEIGTTAVADLNDERYYLVALCRTHIESLKASAEIADLWRALDGLWETVRAGARGEIVNLPLIGGGLSGIGIPSQQLVQVLLISILENTKKQSITANLRLVLHPSQFQHVDIGTLAQEWK